MFQPKHSIPLHEAQTDYLPLVAAVQVIITQPHSLVDPLEGNIIALHEHNYLTAMNALMLILPRHIEVRAIQLFVIQIIIEIVLAIVMITS